MNYFGIDHHNQYSHMTMSALLEVSISNPVIISQASSFDWESRKWKALSISL